MGMKTDYLYAKFTFLTFDCVIKSSSEHDHSNESYWAVLSSGNTYYAFKKWYQLFSLWMISLSAAFQLKATEQYCLLRCASWH